MTGHEWIGARAKTIAGLGYIRGFNPKHVRCDDVKRTL